MPEPVRGGQRYIPGLDGLRAVAVLAVIAYHEQLGWAQGGLLGVGVFFTLSGYLITDLLLGHWAARERLELRDFWLRRARRLLPALFVMLAVVTAWITLLDRAQLVGLRTADAAAASYWSNWYLIATHSSYFARFAPPTPLDHLWSLAVEEQFYLAWPWLLLAGLWLLRRRGRVRSVGWLALPTLALAAASAAEMVLLYHQGLDPTRVYEGSDTRAFGLLIGAALAMVWPSRRPAAPGRVARRLLDGTGIAGLAVIAMLIWRVGQYSPATYRGGLVLLSLATAATVAAAAAPGTVVGRALGWRPLRWIGVRSYGIYLWHYPVIVLTSPANSAEDLPRAALQIVACVAVAALSWQFIEEPVRHGALGRLLARVRSSRWYAQSTGVAGLTAVTAASGVLVLACAGLSGAVRAPSAAIGVADAPLAASVDGGTLAGFQRPDMRPRAPLRTSCRAVAHIGDSTSDGLISPDYLPDPALRIGARYADVGVRTVRFAISGARSVVEGLPGQLNGYQVARNLIRGGFHGCWVIALGTNDTADVVVGSNVSRVARIKEMMSVAAGQPVLWVNVKSLLASGPYAEPDMRLWDAALLQACARYPNMRVYDWAAAARPGWFIPDGIHYTSAGYAARARLIAHALARAFPSRGSSTGCVVG